MFQNRSTVEMRAVIPEEVYDSLYQILERLWEDEKEDYEGRTVEDKDGHLFEALVCVGNWLRSVRHDNVYLI